MFSTDEESVGSCSLTPLKHSHVPLLTRDVAGRSLIVYPCIPLQHKPGLKVSAVDAARKRVFTTAAFVTPAIDRLKRGKLGDDHG
ncbi:hypothetical protein Hypma_014292 [Hypsizygus marmoreus]|uniref:Uncharacterized protein n=1 Tax=Hypsizygus marmoreus TaxID=39966 RepID=A0A369JF63_HYPMA|nr:hypothetical protein Hypma_014292 [Hypsizygus marmoreus]